jgi:proton-dependent oligopeptide transporter, POT family
MSTQAKKGKHPGGLYPLFFTEMWERFGFYLMLGILFLYMTDKTGGGLGFDDFTANEIYGTYIALVYLTPFIGGLLADRLLGYSKTIVFGGALMGLGYCLLAVPNQTAFFAALGLIIVGNGFFKPNISTLLGNLYNDPEYTPLKNQGYNIFYMGINIGAFACNFVAAFMRNQWGWSAAFLSAGIGMFLGLAIFIINQKKVAHADVVKPANKEDMPVATVFAQVFLPAVLIGSLGFILPNLLGVEQLLISKTTDALVLGALPIAFFYLRTYMKATEEDKKPVGALLSIFAVVIVFWMVFHQNGNVLTGWAEKDTRREMAAGLAEKVEIFGVVDSINSDTTYSTMKYDGKVVKRSNIDSINQAIAKKFEKDPEAVKKHQFAEATNKPSPDKPSFTSFTTFSQKQDTLCEASVNAYLLNLPKEEWPTKGKKVYLVNTELFQSLNPGFVVAFTPLVLAFFAFMARRKREPSTPAKIALGLLITGLSTLVMVMAVKASGNGIEKVSWMWLAGTYAVITIGELFLSPMGLSLVHKLSPPRLTAVMMGGWFLSTSIGNKLSGVLGGLNTTFEDKSTIFFINLAGALFAAALLFIMVKNIRAVVRAKTGSD